MQNVITESLMLESCDYQHCIVQPMHVEKKCYCVYLMEVYHILNVVWDVYIFLDTRSVKNYSKLGALLAVKY